RRSAFVRRLRADAPLYRCGRAYRHGEVWTNGAVLVGARDRLSGTESAQPAADEISDRPAAPTDHGLLRINLAFIQELMHFLADHHRVKIVRVAAVLQTDLILVVNEFVILLAGRGQLAHPGVALPARQAVKKSFQEDFLITDDAQVERPVSAKVFRNR